MKPPESQQTEIAGVNEGPAVADRKALRRGRGPTFTEIASVSKEPEIVDLKGLREARGLTLKDIFSVTRITVTNLEAIEAGHYHLLPAPVYTRTFIKTYAGILGTDSKPILQQYEEYLISCDKIQEVPEEDHKALPRKEKRKNKIRIILSLVAAAVLCGLISLIVLVDVRDVTDLFSIQQANSPKPVSSPAPAPAPGIPPVTPATEATRAALTQPGQVPAIQIAGSQKQEPALNLKIEATEKTWVRISADGKEHEQKTMEKGDQIERTARESFVVDIGNAGGILVTFQGKPLPSLGKRGEVIHLKLP
jgi:cytoskeletal protein RodZ